MTAPELGESDARLKRRIEQLERVSLGSDLYAIREAACGVVNAWREIQRRDAR